MQWLLFSLSAPLTWGIANVVDKVIRTHLVKNDLTLTWLSGLMRIPFILGLTFFVGIEVPNITTFVGMLITGALWVLPFILYFKAMAIEEASRIALLINIVPLFTLFFSALIIGERLTYIQSIAFALFLGGGVLASLKNMNGNLRMSKAALLIALASATWGLSDVLFKKYAIDFSRGFFSAMNVDLLGGLLVIIVITMVKPQGQFIWKKLGQVRARGWTLILISNLIGTAGSVFFGYALTLHKASLTSVMLGVQPLVAFLVSFILSRYFSSVQREELGARTLVIKLSSLVCFLGGLSLL